MEKRTQMKILVVNYEYPPVGGGGGRVAAQIAGELVRRGHEVRVQTARTGDLPRQEIIAGVDVRRSFSFRRKPDTCNVPEMAGYMVSNTWPVLGTVRTWRPDVMHVHFAVPTGPVAWVAHQLAGVPYVLTAHLGDVPGGTPEQTDHLFRLAKPFTRPVWRDAAAITAVSSHVSDLARKAYGVEARVILNGTSTRVRNPPSPDTEGLLRLLFVGRMSVQKNPVFLGKVLSTLRGRPWRAVFLGDGPLREPLEKILRQGGITAQCELRGWVDSAVVQQVMNSSDVLVMPSLSEGLPVASVEAISHGLAIVGSDIPGLRDVLQDGVNGWVLPVSDGAAWERILKTAIGNRVELHRRQQQSLRIAEKFDLGVIVDAYEETLSTVALKQR